jgi:hypothetical protein
VVRVALGQYARALQFEQVEELRGVDVLQT